jgi:hypothetical protein
MPAWPRFVPGGLVESVAVVALQSVLTPIGPIVDSLRVYAELVFSTVVCMSSGDRTCQGPVHKLPECPPPARLPYVRNDLSPRAARRQTPDRRVIEVSRWRLSPLDRPLLPLPACGRYPFLPRAAAVVVGESCSRVLV